MTVTSFVPAALQRELAITKPIGPGKSAGAKLVQEYLSLNGIGLTIDGDWGAATTKGLNIFAPGRTTVDAALLARLALPLTRMLDPVQAENLRAAIVATAKKHLAVHPVEIGGQNAGPFVRAYMDGYEGPKWPWCAGFVTRVIQQACLGVGITEPAHLKRTYSCDALGMWARNANKLVPGTDKGVAAGDVFLVPSKVREGDWIHTGLIIGVDAGTFTTIEGNTNDTGSREGFEVCQRIRGRAAVDVVAL